MIKVRHILDRSHLNLKTEGSWTVPVMIRDKGGAVEFGKPTLVHEPVGYLAEEDRGGPVSVFSGPTGPVGTIAFIALHVMSGKPIDETTRSAAERLSRGSTAPA